MASNTALENGLRRKADALKRSENENTALRERVRELQASLRELVSYYGRTADDNFKPIEIRAMWTRARNAAYPGCDLIDAPTGNQDGKQP